MAVILELEAIKVLTHNKNTFDMKNYLFALLFPVCFWSCGPYYSQTKMYEFIVDNQLENKNIEIFPESPTSPFWITSHESYLVISGEKIIVGSQIEYNKDKEALDIYKTDDIIEPFDVYVEGVKCEVNFSLREHWSFLRGKAKASGKYILTFDKNTLKN